MRQQFTMPPFLVVLHGKRILVISCKGKKSTKNFTFSFHVTYAQDQLDYNENNYIRIQNIKSLEAKSWSKIRKNLRGKFTGWYARFLSWTYPPVCFNLRLVLRQNGTTEEQTQGIIKTAATRLRLAVSNFTKMVVFIFDILHNRQIRWTIIHLCHYYPALYP